jgi:hypothetical protein
MADKKTGRTSVDKDKGEELGPGRFLNSDSKERTGIPNPQNRIMVQNGNGNEDEGIRRSYEVKEERRMFRNVAVISLSFTLLFTAFQSMSNLQSSLNPQVNIITNHNRRVSINRKSEISQLCMQMTSRETKELIMHSIFHIPSFSLDMEWSSATSKSKQ